MNGPFSLVRRYSSIGSLGNGTVGGRRSFAGVSSGVAEFALMTRLSVGASAIGDRDDLGCARQMSELETEPRRGWPPVS